MSLSFLTEVREVLFVIFKALATAGGLGSWDALLRLSASFPDSVQAIAAVLEVVATSAIAGVAAVWAIHNYNRTRQRQPVLNMEHRIFHKRIVEPIREEHGSVLTFWKRKRVSHDPEPLNACLLRVTVTVSNDGPILIEGFSGEVVVYVIHSGQAELLRAVRRWRDAQDQDIEGSHTVDFWLEGKKEFPWDTVAQGSFERDPSDADLEPNESDEFSFDFLVDGRWETLLVYSRIENPRKKSDELNWSRTTVYELGKE